MASSSHSSRLCERYTNASANVAADTPLADPMISQLRRHRSAHTPAKGATSKAGKAPARDAYVIQAPEDVTSAMCHRTANTTVEEPNTNKLALNK